MRVMMSVGRTRRGPSRKLQLFYLIILVCYFGGIRKSCATPKPGDSGSVNVTSPLLGRSALPGPPPRVQTRIDLFHEEKPKFVSSEQWAEWKGRYGFAPLGDFCDDCRRVPGKCRHLQICQDYCADDCNGHGNDFSISILCSWCGGAREDRCRDWSSCREHCEILCLHERYRLKVEADLKREDEQTRKHHRQLYEDYLRKREEKERMSVEKQKAVWREQLEETRKHLAGLAELEYYPLKEEL